MFSKELKKDHLLPNPFETRHDPYYWLRLSDEQKLAENRDKHTNRVVHFLHQENNNTEATLKDTETLQATLYQEMTGRLMPDEAQVPYFNNGYWYAKQFREGKEYPVYGRGKDATQLEVVIDCNTRAEGFDYYHLSNIYPSPDHKWLAFGEDNLSRRMYTIALLDINTGSLAESIVQNTTGHVVWTPDGSGFYYVKRDDVLRPFQIWLHILGRGDKTDVLIYEETDPLYRVGVKRSADGEFVLIGSYATETSYFHYIKSTDLTTVILFHKKTYKLEYYPDHYSDGWYIRTNLNAPNFKMMRTDVPSPSSEWSEVHAYDTGVYMTGFHILKNHLLVDCRINGRTEILAKPHNSTEWSRIPLNEGAYTVEPEMNISMELDYFRVAYTSLTEPPAVLSWDLTKNEVETLKVQEVRGGYDTSKYESKYFTVTSHDGVEIPVSMVYKKDRKALNQRPCLLYGYGSYGISIDPYFSPARLSLLDRGFSFAIAHIRGGAEMGIHWYKDGKFLNKKNTFNDFISSGEYLIENKLVKPNGLYAMGGSAGGLLMGAVMNMRPDLWAGIIAAVPFVDVLTTMLDTSIPLTVGEYEEWGNPNEQAYYEYIKSYSPYDNVEKKAYPPLLVTTGYHDSQVQYWEPAKWVAKLREYKTNSTPLLLHTQMEAGHGGASGRFQRYKEIALEYAFLLWLEGIEH